MAKASPTSEVALKKRKKKITRTKELVKLSPSHKNFCRTLIADHKMNQTQTYLDTMATPNMRRVTAKDKAGNLMKNKLIRVELQRLMDLRAERLDLTADKVLAEISQIAFMKFDDYGSYDEDGNVVLKPSDEVDTRGIKSIKRRIVSSDENSTTEAFEVKFHDKLKALELTMRHLGLLNENLINVGKVEVKIQLPKGLDESIIN